MPSLRALSSFCSRNLDLKTDFHFNYHFQKQFKSIPGFYLSLSRSRANRQLASSTLKASTVDTSLECSSLSGSLSLSLSRSPRRGSWALGEGAAPAGSALARTPSARKSGSDRDENPPTEASSSAGFGGFGWRDSAAAGAVGGGRFIEVRSKGRPSGTDESSGPENNFLHISFPKSVKGSVK